jgi:protein SCO1/2
MQRRTVTAIAASAVGALLIAVGVMFGQLIRHSSEPDRIPIGGPFELVDQEGHAVTDKTFLGRPSVISFGYTSCPDVCPTTLMDLSNWLKALGSRADKLNVLFISIDPAPSPSRSRCHRNKPPRHPAYGSVH